MVVIPRKMEFIAPGVQETSDSGTSICLHLNPKLVSISPKVKQFTASGKMVFAFYH